MLGRGGHLRCQLGGSRGQRILAEQKVGAVGPGEPALDLGCGRLPEDARQREARRQNQQAGNGVARQVGQLVPAGTQALGGARWWGGGVRGGRGFMVCSVGRYQGRCAGLEQQRYRGGRTGQRPARRWCAGGGAFTTGGHFAGLRRAAPPVAGQPPVHASPGRVSRPPSPLPVVQGASRARRFTLALPQGVGRVRIAPGPAGGGVGCRHRPASVFGCLPCPATQGRARAQAPPGGLLSSSGRAAPPRPGRAGWQPGQNHPGRRQNPRRRPSAGRRAAAGRVQRPRRRRGTIPRPPGRRPWVSWPAARRSQP